MSVQMRVLDALSEEPGLEVMAVVRLPVTATRFGQMMELLDAEHEGCDVVPSGDPNVVVVARRLR